MLVSCEVVLGGIHANLHHPNHQRLGGIARTCITNYFHLKCLFYVVHTIIIALAPKFVKTTGPFNLNAIIRHMFDLRNCAVNE